MKSVDTLEQIGFINIGHLEIDQGDQIRFCGNRYDVLSVAGGVLYAFIVAGEIRYIGKSTQRFEKRFNGYIKPGSSQKTNMRLSPLLKEVLKSGTCIEVYGFSKFDTESYPGFRLSHAAGLEDTLIDTLKPVWNLSGKKRKKS